jgi:hypothetical protein
MRDMLPQLHTGENLMCYMSELGVLTKNVTVMLLIVLAEAALK